MMSEHLSDGAIPRGRTSAFSSDHGRAALILVESLMHALVAKQALSREDFIDIIDVASEVECDLLAANDPSRSTFSRSLLYPLAAAFRQELGR